MKFIYKSCTLFGMSDEETQNQESADTKSEILAFIWETVKVVAISLAIILPIRYYLVQPFFVKGASMEPNFEDGDYILIDELSYDFSNPSRGDVVIFRHPLDPSNAAGPYTFYIKRVIGLPGETVEIKDNEVIIYNKKYPDGFQLDEKYLALGQVTRGNLVTKLDDNEYFVLGDNRLQSSDSRYWGPVNKSLLTGRAFLRPWPFTRAAKISPVIYNLTPL